MGKIYENYRRRTLDFTKQEKDPSPSKKSLVKQVGRFSKAVSPGYSERGFVIKATCVK
ncbi:TPA: hypothetical protein ACXYLK_003369 [Legionella pneumophila]|uniref:hypothetical protein n=1 Tax=Legionella anisa TaxID=28082 RepID=UPI000346D222|nr:hypothetical protein [Legionella anisa]MCW8426776.1 hypothetical protein [Legionella anisa]MCW8449556.1 hypothetical protein [Legionella anisa]